MDGTNGTNGTNSTNQSPFAVAAQPIGDASRASKVSSVSSVSATTADPFPDRPLTSLALPTPQPLRTSASQPADAQQQQQQQQQQRKRPEAPLPPHTVVAQADFLASYRAPLIAAVAQSAPPIYQGPSTLPSAHVGLLLRKPLGAQRLALFAAACGLRGQRPTKDPRTGVVLDPGWRRTAGLGLVFEMGTGKTYCALAALAMADEDVTRRSAPPDRRPEKSSFFPAIVLCPPIMQEKWAREAAMTLPTARPVILRPITTREEAATFRRFDPSFTGKKLSAIGVCDRVARRIQRELAQWRGARDQALAAGKRPPRKPCHTVVISQSTAKFGVPWTPVYVLRVLREWSTRVDPATGQEVTRIRAQRDPETGALITVPCCPHCYAPIAEDERHANARERRAKKRARKTTEPRNEEVGGESTKPTGPISRFPSSDSHAEVAVIVGDGDDDDLENMGGLGGLGGFGEDLPYLSEADLLGIGRARSKHTCAACGGALWQNVPEGARWQATPPPLDGDVRHVAPMPIPDRMRRISGITSTANRRYPVADYLRKRYRGLFRTLIADEAHQYQGAGTAQGYAAASLVDACGPQGTAVALTGTLFAGYASTLFWMLWRLMPSIREHFGYDEVGRWIGRYGLRQKTIKVEESSGGATGWRSKRRDTPPRYRELPGISPLILNLLLPHCLFMDLADVAPDLPPYHEEVVTIPLGSDLEREYQRFEREATDNLKAQLQLGDNSGTSSWFHGLLIWPNLPCQEIVARAKRTSVELGRAPALPASTVYPKERALLDLVRRERAEGRRCLVYVEHTGEHDLLPRLTQLLQDDDAAWREEDPEDYPGAPVRIVTLRGGTVSTSQREAWLAKQVEAGCDVLLCHSGLVEVGLDLLAFPTILVYEIIFSTTRWRQSIRRSWRPGQTREVRVIQLTYERTMEARGLTLIATKAIASLMVEGKMPSAALNEHAQNSATTNLIMELFTQVAADIEQLDHLDHLDAPGLPTGRASAPSAGADGAGNPGNAGADGLGVAQTSSAVTDALRSTFLALTRVEQEAEAFIGVNDADDADDLEDDAVDEGNDELAGADEGDGGNADARADDIPLGSAMRPLQGTAQDGPYGQPTPPGQLRQTDLRMDSLWSLATPLVERSGVGSEAPTRTVPTTAETPATQASSEASEVSVPQAHMPHTLPLSASSAARQSLPSQHQVTWDQLRAQLKADAARRKAKRHARGAGSVGGSSDAPGSLWTTPGNTNPSPALFPGSATSVTSSRHPSDGANSAQREQTGSLTPERAHTEAETETGTERRTLSDLEHSTAECNEHDKRGENAESNQCPGVPPLPLLPPSRSDVPSGAGAPVQPVQAVASIMLNEGGSASTESDESADAEAETDLPAPRISGAVTQARLFDVE